MSSTPEMTGMDQVQRWHDQMIYFVPAKQGSYPHPGQPVQPVQPVHPHSVPGSYVWWPQQPLPPVPPAAPPAVPAVAPVAETEPKEQGRLGLDASCSTLATPRSTEAPDGSDIVERRLSASAARRLRRKRAAERSRVGAAGAANGANGANPAMSIDELRAELRRDPNSGIQCLKGQVWRLSRDANGCRLVQEALEVGSREVTDLANELQGHVLEAVMCPYANYVVQKVVSHLSVAASSFVATELQGNAVRAAKHRFACRIFCRLLEFCGRGPTSQLVDELLARDDGEHENLCSHSFAHHVIQSILEHGEERHKKLIAKMLLSDLWRYATHKNSSYLIEKAICYCSTEDQNHIIAKLGHPQAMLDLAMAQYGSFVARALLSDSRVNSTAALQHIAEHKADVESTKHGHRFLLDVGLEQPEFPCGYCPNAPNAPFPSAFGAQYAQNPRHVPPGIEEQREMSSTWQDGIDDDWPSTSEGEEIPIRGKRKRRKRKRKRNKPRPLRKKPLPPAEATLEEQPLFFGGVFGPLSRSCQWLCVLEDVHRRSFVSIRKQAFTANTLAQWRKTLMREVRWHKPERPPKEGKSQEPLDVLLPRSAAWLTIQGCRCEYEYAGLRFPPVAMPQWFLEITDEVTRACGLEDRPNSCNLNLYRNGADNVSWHCDDEPLFDATGRDALIVSLSLGATRSFQLRPKDDPFEETLLHLEDGDLCTMEGLCQKHYRHRVPPEEDVTEPRINLTWRWIVQHDPGCNLSNPWIC